MEYIAIGFGITAIAALAIGLGVLANRTEGWAIRWLVLTPLVVVAWLLLGYLLLSLAIGLGTENT